MSTAREKFHAHINSHPTGLLLAAIKHMDHLIPEFTDRNEAERMTSSCLFDEVANRHDLWTWLDSQPDTFWDLPDHEALTLALAANGVEL